MNTANINQLIACTKRVTQKPSKDPVIQKASRQWEFSLTSIDPDPSEHFHVFLRQHCVFEENFSVGLRYSPKVGKPFCLVRFNGFHQHRNQVVDSRQFEAFHIHKATEEALQQEISAENFAEPTNDYATFETAIVNFWKYVNIQGFAEEHFLFLSHSKQLNLLDQEA